MRSNLEPFRKSGLANCFGRQQPIEGRVPVLVPPGEMDAILLSAVRGLETSHMHLHHTSTQQQRAVALFPTTRRRMPAQLSPPEGSTGLWADGSDGTGRCLRLDARSHTHEAKKAIVAEMRE